MTDKHSPQNRIDQSVGEYDKLYDTEGGLRESDAFYQWVLKKLPLQRGRALLDIACGEGHLLRYAESYGLKCFGLDFSYKALKIVQKNLIENRIILANGELLPIADDRFDFVANIGSLEHFFNPEKGLREMHRILKPDGLAVLVLPNSYYLLDIIWHVWRRGYPVGHRQPIERFATYGQWRDLIEANGLTVIKTYKYNLCWPRSAQDWRWYQKRPKQLLSALFGPFTPFNLSYSFLFICKSAD
jgi:ubiquinone/menaquinone biosynthesis C-methylase UbiE